MSSDEERQYDKKLYTVRPRNRNLILAEPTSDQHRFSGSLRVQMAMFTSWTARVSQPFLKHPDRLSGGLLFIVAILALVEALRLPFGSITAPDAGFFPQTLSVLLLVCSFLILVHSFTRELEAAEFDRRSWLVPISAAVLIGYALVLPRVGFVLATTTVMLLIMRGLVKMPWLRAIVISLPTVLLSYLAFVKLGVPLPRGPLPF